MILKLIIYDANGRETGQTRLRMEFGEGKWKVEEDIRGAWARISPSTSGDLEVLTGDTVHIKDQQPGKPQSVIVRLLNVPASDVGVGNAGTGRVVADGGGIFWGFESATYSKLRGLMVDMLVSQIPMSGLSSDMAAFKSITGYDTKRINAEFWEPTDPKIKKNTTFTCCNLFLGCMAIKLGTLIGKKPGTWLTRGVLHLELVDKDVPGSWVTPNGSNFPKPGDFYSVSGLNQNGDFQKFKHVGIVGKVENGAWLTVDGGQGGYSQKKDWIKWCDRGTKSTANMNGWIDIDKYFGSGPA